MGKFKKIFGYGYIGVIISAVILALALWIEYYLNIPRMNKNVSLTLAIVFLVLFFFTGHYTLKSLPIPKRGTKVIRKGIYRKLRHPLYSAGVFLFYPAIAFFLQSWVVLITTPVIFRIFSVISRIEEVYMIRQFGEDYKKYMKEVGSFLPKLRKPKK